LGGWSDPAALLFVLYEKVRLSSHNAAQKFRLGGIHTLFFLFVPVLEQGHARLGARACEHFLEGLRNEIYT